MNTATINFIATSRVKAAKQWLFCCLFLLTQGLAKAQSDLVINVTTSVTPPISSNFTQMSAAGNVRVTFTVNGFGAATETVLALGRIECLAPSPFTIDVSPNYSPTQFITVTRGVPRQLNGNEIRDAFGNFIAGNLVATGVNINTIVDANNNLRLPEGTYRVCFRAVARSMRDASRPELGCGTFVVPSATPPNGITITTRFTPPANANIFQAISRGNIVPVLLYNNPASPDADVKIFGRIEALSPNPFTIALRADYSQQDLFSLRSGVPVQMTPGQVVGAFGNFNEANLVTSGTSLAQLRDPNNNIVLPDGVYRVCFYAQYYKDNAVRGPASNINLGCASFNICSKAGAPQFTQPISNYTLSSALPAIRMASPVIFTWTPPIATCGLNLSTVTYDLEIREMFESQTVTDAINNPPVFTKTLLRSPTFLLDTMLYQQVLQKGHLYVARVRANSALDAPIVIDNGGFSRVQAFRYGEAADITRETVPVTIFTEKPRINTLIPTSVLKGRAVWSFKKAEEELPVNNSVLQTIDNIDKAAQSFHAGGKENNTGIQQAIDPNLRAGALLTGNKNTGFTAVGNGQVNTAANAKAQPAVNTQSTAPQQMLLTGVIGDGTTTELRDLKIAPEKGKNTHPLAGAKVFIKGVKATGTAAGANRVSTDSPKSPATTSLGTQLGMYNSVAQTNLIAGAATNAGVANLASTYSMPDESKLDEDLLASGTTDAAGNFAVNFIDPKFRNITKYTKLHITVEQEDFEKYSSFMPVVAPDANGDINLGDVQLVAKSFRYTPSVPGLNFSATIDLYAPSASYNARPHYAFMAKAAGAEKKTIAGKEYVKIATVKNGQTINQLFYQHSWNDNFIVQINATGKEQYAAYLGIIPVAYGSAGAGGSGFAADLDESKMVISVKKRYTLQNQLPYITGKVEMFVEDRNNNANSATFPNAGAMVTVSFDKSKVVESYKEKVSGEGAKDPDAASHAGMNIVTTVTGANKPVAGVSNNKNINSKVNPVANKVVATGNQPNNALAGGTTNLSGQNDFKLVSVTNPTIGAQVTALFQYSTSTDSNGYYRIDKLPVLQEGAFFTVTVRNTDGMDSARQGARTLKRGETDEVNFQFRPEVYTVTGIAVDEAGIPLHDALLIWRSGGNPIEANSNGLFVTSNYKDDSLTIKNQGYIDKTIFVKIDKSKGPAKGSGKATAVNNYTAGYTVNNSGSVNEWATALVGSPSVVAATKPTPASNNAGGTKPASLVFGYAVNRSAAGTTTLANELAPMFHDLFGSTLQPVGTKDLGKVGFLQKGFAKINFVVTDAGTSAAVKGAVVTIDETFDTTTNASGTVLYKGGGSAFTYTVTGAAGSDYIVQAGEMSVLPVDGSVTTVKVLLEHGVALTGKVTSKGKNIEGADIAVDGKEYITTKSKADGSYALFIPKGENTVKATKPAYTGRQINKNFSGSSVENFELGDGGGRNISKLLGFDIELENQTPDGAGEQWTGSFVNLKANTVFAAPGNKKLKFTNVKVTFDGAGNPLVAGGQVKTDVTEMNMKLFGYVPITIKGSPQITVREETAGKGTIGGKVQLNLGQVGSAGGMLFGDYMKPLLIAAGGAIDKDIPVFVADGSSPVLSFAFSNAREEIKKAADKAVTDFQAKVDKAKGDGKAALVAKLNELKTAASSAAAYTTGTAVIPATLDQYAGVEIYGFQAMLNLAKCKIDASGLDMAGFVLSPDLPILSTMFFDLEKLKLGTDFSIKDISVKSNLNVKFSIASWSAEINTVAFSTRGFKVAGKIEVQVPQSPKNTLQFSDLAFGSSGLYGGSFSFPGDGLSIFNIINLKTGGTPLSFGEIGNTGVYKLGGSAKFSFGKLFKESIDVPYFQIQTNGQFGVTVPVNKALNAGFAKFALNSITFNTTTPSPQIDLDGQFSVDVKLLKLSTGGVHFRTSGVTVDKIGLGLDIPGTKVDAYLDIKENGFAGGGSLGVVATNIKVAIDFHYFKMPNGGVDLGASFIAGVKIPIGPVIITKVGGGFTYRSNPEFFSVTITGGASITGFEEAISLDPISITIESGPKIVGEAHLKVASLDVAKAKLVIDIPNEYFALGVVADFQPLPDLVKAHLQGDLILSTKATDTYFFLGAGVNVDLLGLIKSEGVFALGFGVKNAKTRETISYYMQKAPDDYLNNGSFSGIYVNGVSEMGVKKEDAPGLDLGIISGKLWLYSRSDFGLIANFKNANFRINAGMAFEGGIQGCFTFICAEASAKACVNIAGGFTDAKGWNFNANASGEAVLAAGHSCGCNDVCIGMFYAGGKICVGAGAKIVYESRTGGLKQLSMFIGSKSTCP
ncbi:MAG: carboxypeptidase-like regulatory domain-containing protein [Chitinophagaceae bacterium]